MLTMGEEEATWPFQINEDTGEIITSGFIDRELRERYFFRVRASDSSPVDQLDAVVNVTITIEDVNDNPPICKLFLFNW